MKNSYLTLMQGKIYLVPCPIIEDGISSLPPATLEVLHTLDHFIVERARTARRFIKESGHPKPIAELEIFELDKHGKVEGLKDFILKTKNIYDLLNIKDITIIKTPKFTIIKNNNTLN